MRRTKRSKMRRRVVPCLGNLAHTASESAETVPTPASEPVLTSRSTPRHQPVAGEAGEGKGCVWWARGSAGPCGGERCVSAPIASTDGVF